MAMLVARSATFISFLLLMIRTSIAQNSSSNSTAFCNRTFHSIVVANSTLYVDGGELRTASDGEVFVLIPSTVDTIDLSKRFSTSDTSIWSHISKNGTTQDAPTMNDGSIFASSTNLYLFGGGISVASPAIGAPTTLPPNAVWQYDTGNLGWSQAILTGSPVQRMVDGMSVQSTSGSAAYYLGGAHTPSSDPYFWTVPNATPYLDQGLLTFDEASAGFQNASTSGLNEYGTAAGGFVNLIESIGSKGVLVAFGGISNVVGRPQNLTDQGWLDSSSHWNLTSVSVYDIGGGTWYQQTTSGDIPRWRYHGCSVTVSALDQSSHSIYVFGGWGTTYENSDGGVYVLSIPSFTWTLVNQDSTLRSRHHCSLIGQNTMLIVGGIAPMDDWPMPTWTTAGCDNTTMFAQGLGMFSLNNHSWSTSYDPVVGAQAYQVHPSISKVIGGNANGGAVTQEPIGGFDQQALGALLASNKTSSNNNNTTATTSPQQLSPHSKTHLSIGAMAGIIGASITGFILLLATSFILLIRRHRKSVTRTNAAEMSAQLERSEMSAHKFMSEIGSSSSDIAAAPPAELSDSRLDEKMETIYVGHAELGDVKEWVFELGAGSVRDKSLPPTPGVEKEGMEWTVEVEKKGCDDKW